MKAGFAQEARTIPQNGEAGNKRDRSEQPPVKAITRAGAIGGLVGGVVIWIYEALVWVGAQHLMPLSGIPPNATGLVFGKPFQHALGLWAYPLGTSIHFGFAIAWGILFAAIWPHLRRRGYEATLLALPFGAVAWITMHVAISIATRDHPNYKDPTVIIGGFMSHFFFAIPMALVVKRLLGGYQAQLRQGPEESAT